MTEVISASIRGAVGLGRTYASSMVLGALGLSVGLLVLLRSLGVISA